ncbi:MAG: NAD-dependent epimerase/dehydratase family protein, partial [Bacteroidota bacterium]|nr:NAD-dependent epimerase/dehydratase family protein [Bacteroidota bacterium]
CFSLRKTSKLDTIKKIFSFYSNTPETLLKKIDWFDADLSDIVSLNDAFRNVDIVYHCAARISMNNKNYSKSYETNVNGTANIVNLSLQHGIKKMCHVSSIAAVGVNPNSLTTEEDHLNPEETKSFYSLTKYYSEMEVWRGIEEGLNAVIVNPSVILAPYILNKIGIFFLNYFLKKRFKYFTCGKKGYIDVNDLAEIMILLTESEISKERFLINAENLSFKQIIDYANNFNNNGESHKELSKFQLNLLKILMSILTFGHPPLTKQIIHYLLNDDVYSNEKLLNTIEYKYTPIKQNINNMLNIYTKKL